MLNIVCVCHNGMGTSMLLKINVNNICMENGISASVEACGIPDECGYRSDQPGDRGNASADRRKDCYYNQYAEQG